MRDLRQAVRALRHRPWYTASILAVIAVGCGTLASVLAIVDGVLFKPLPYPDAAQLVTIRVSSTRSRISPIVTTGDMAAWARAAPEVAFTGFHSFTGMGWDSMRGRALVQPDFFDVIGVSPVVGGFQPEDFLGPPRAIEPRVLTDDVFRSEFGGDPGAIGRVVIFNPIRGLGYRVAGVMPRGFVFPLDRLRVGYLTPYLAGSLGTPIVTVIARVPPGASTKDLESRVLVTAVAAEKASSRGFDPTNPPVDQVDVQPLSRALGAANRSLFAAFFFAAAVLLAVAVINAASLTQARSLDRAREVAMRRALGATGWDLGWLLLLEHGLLASAGAAIGLAASAPLLGITVQLLPDDVNLLRSAAIDGRVAAFVGLLAVMLTGLTSLGPLRHATAIQTRPDPARTATPPTHLMGRGLVVGLQVALALVLTVAGSLLVGSLLSVYAQTPPITTAGVITIRSRFLDQSRLSRSPESVAQVTAMVHRLRSVPGVDAAAAVAASLLDRGYSSSWFVPPAGASATRLVVQRHAVTAGYYSLVAPQVVAGRLPTASEQASAAPVIVVGERVASHFWPQAPAIGQTLEHERTRQLFTVVGVVRDTRWSAWDADPVPVIYGPYAHLVHSDGRSPTFLIRTSTDTTRVAEAALRVMREADPLLRPERPVLLDDLFIDSVRPRRLTAWLFGSFAAAALFVMGTGVFGQLAMATARRTREVGIRMTCGAARGHIVRLIFREQLRPVVAGIVAGSIGAAWAVRFLRSYLYQLSSIDTRVWTAAIGLILVTAAAGALLPALRASRIDPAESLRAE